jgi:hypothetical protein
MTDKDFGRKYTALLNGLEIPPSTSSPSELDPASRVFYIAWDRQREEAAEADPSLELGEDTASQVYRFILSMWADMIANGDAANIILEETVPSVGPAKCMVTVGEVPTALASGESNIVPRVTAYLQAAFRAYVLPVSTYEPSEDYGIEWGTMRLKRDDTTAGDALPVRMVLEPAS